MTGFPTEGAVEGMTDGGQPPLEPEQSEGTPPELEDTQGQSNNETINDKKTKRSDDLL
ncbi:hypothetical protein [Marinilactibacillus psychrotolerans]|uniref:Uncharacterized protein n=3 Tax=Marinilactibacillus psychrotolerans TaxID=191770 RepID=A0AAV3WPJ5_9LACT|nr:hypothetical protein [Marinilactibacillus psychrotolerans]GEQ34745.1 hypothetical protein M132T_02530 [Marinilactibacillus psychrotolerans]SJN44387.1 hypothetical protein FM115_10570 [Marinilactibacillus psychrotolerans 42ea]